LDSDTNLIYYSNNIDVSTHAPRTQTPAIDDGNGAAATCDSRAEAFMGWPKFLWPSGELAGQAQAQTQSCAVPLFSFGAGADS
jgi:hypothetical protein